MLSLVSSIQIGQFVFLQDFLFFLRQKRRKPKFSGSIEKGKKEKEGDAYLEQDALSDISLTGAEAPDDVIK